MNIYYIHGNMELHSEWFLWTQWMNSVSAMYLWLTTKTNSYNHENIKFSPNMIQYKLELYNYRAKSDNKMIHYASNFDLNLWTLYSSNQKWYEVEIWYAISFNVIWNCVVFEKTSVHIIISYSQVEWKPLQIFFLMMHLLKVTCKKKKMLLPTSVFSFNEAKCFK